MLGVRRRRSRIQSSGRRADCPKCGLQCRSLAQVDDPEMAVIKRLPCLRKRQSRGKANLNIQGDSCTACGSPNGLQNHHIDWNHNNNSPKNLMPLCEWCHMKAGKLGKPLFDKLLDRVLSNPRERAELRKRSDEWYQKLPQHRNTRNINANTNNIRSTDHQQGRLF